MTHRRSIRPDLPPPGDAILVRALFDALPSGQDFDRVALIDDASYNFELFGYYGLSLWLPTEMWPLDRILAEKTRRAARVALFSVESVTQQGLRLVASGREPHYGVTDGQFIVGGWGSVRITAGSAQTLVDRFLAAAYTIEKNSSFEQDVR